MGCSFCSNSGSSGRGGRNNRRQCEQVLCTFPDQYQVTLPVTPARNTKHTTSTCGGTPTGDWDCDQISCDLYAGTYILDKTAETDAQVSYEGASVLLDPTLLGSHTNAGCVVVADVYTRIQIGLTAPKCANGLYLLKIKYNDVIRWCDSTFPTLPRLEYIFGATDTYGNLYDFEITYQVPPSVRFICDATNTFVTDGNSTVQGCLCAFPDTITVSPA